ncbi:MAG TPA: hypothetical protein VD816_18730 [Ohtaekwangia sp.]|nr:hypothetical protein [Ohtaekwangia sp.]
MKKLEDIPKKKVFTVPDGYFEKLPAAVQSRVHRQDTRAIWTGRLRYAFPVVVVLGLSVFWFTRDAATAHPEAVLATIPTSDLVGYLADSDLSVEDLLDNVALDDADAAELEEAVYALDFSDEQLQDLMNDVELKSL